MKSNDFIKKLEEYFIQGNPDYLKINWNELELSGVRIVQIADDTEDLRNSSRFSGHKWVVGTELYEDCYKNAPNLQQWDMTTDGDYLCYRFSLGVHLYFQTENLDEQQIQWLKHPEISETEDYTRRESLLPVLTDLLVNKRYPFSNIYTGELELKYGIHLKLIQKGEHRHMRYKPGYGKSDWVKYKPLDWGGLTGWSITTDVKIACCRVGYDEYYNFEIEVLSDNQVNYYKKKYGLDESFAFLKMIQKLDEVQMKKMIEYVGALMSEVKNK